MQFIDKTKIFIKAGDGGDGCAAFHREKFVQNGGPSGGDGGKGGDLVFVADAGMNTLVDFKMKQHYRAQNGDAGQQRMKTGADGEALRIPIPVGTIIRDVESGAILADMSEPGREKTVLFGGRGGKGNARFATPTRQAPRFAQNGQRTREIQVELELKTIADVGLIGMPSVGKSTLLSVLTAARPKIAAYHFTTLTPNLGVAEHKGNRFVLADIPGLIEGAAAGYGLGHDFLRHIERTRMLLHVVDVSGSEGRDPLADFAAIQNELLQFSPVLGALPQFVVGNKMDIPGAEENLEALKAALAPMDIPVFGVSAAAHSGFEALLNALIEKLAKLEPVTVYAEAELDMGYLYERGFTITRDPSAAYVVQGGDVDRILDTTDPDDEISMRRFQQLLVKQGIIDALRERGAKEGDSIVMGGWEFEFVD
ncbi:MAG: GTPase ObgE [Clostridiales bacterium]|nr:GTPase ObgE [Clostridiales bacterium]